jgi:hypothetical protein
MDKQSKLSAYVAEKLAAIQEKLSIGNFAHCVWDIFVLSLIENEAVRA